jgi:hypothetical protein
MLEPIQDNDNYKPHANNYSNLYMFTQVIRKQESVMDGQTDGQTDGRTDRRTDRQFTLDTF